MTKVHTQCVQHYRGQRTLTPLGGYVAQDATGKEKEAWSKEMSGICDSLKLSCTAIDHI